MQARELTFSFPALDEALDERTEIMADMFMCLYEGKPPTREFWDKFLRKVDPEVNSCVARLILSAKQRDDRAFEQARDEFAGEFFESRWRLFSKFDLEVVNLFASHSVRDPRIRKGSSLAFQAALSQIPEVAEEELSWDQVCEFRKDSEAVRKYRALKMWLQSSVNAETLSEAEGIIALKLDEYEWAIKKHGLKTVTGALASIVSSDALVSITAGSGIAAIFHKPIWALISSGLIMGTKVGVWIAERRIDLHDIRYGPNSEVALIYEAKQLAESAQPPLSADA
jgi:hypothetical protein